ncbi:MFS-type transporter SLC18B1 [Galendromus occidentalis]|uniref:MFS-type transporter SLC18B1 n=1 Tax=Galendromus occidentalis TaxID=34638 RepID=A0AAJ6QMU0_9ACAR|nr:MFS-type transporter SLC18B1 [Galendromus occidentalis]
MNTKKAPISVGLILTILCAGLLLQGAGDSHMASFLSEHAQRVGMSTMQYGIIMGTNSVVAITVLPLIPKFTMLNIISDKCFLIIGYLIDATAMLAITSVDFLGLTGSSFFFALLALRIVQSVGASIGFTLVYSVSGVELPDHSHLTVPFLETMYGTGLTLGPAISGALYDLGGFPLPFTYHSAMLFGLAFVAGRFLPQHAPADSEEERGLSLKKMLRPTILICMLMVATSNIVDTFNDSTLAMLLHRFSLPTTLVGLSFFLSAGSYTASSLVSGLLSDGPHRQLVLLICPLITIISLIFLAPLVPMAEHPLWLVYICQLLLGLSVGPMYVYCYLLTVADLTSISDNKTAHTATAAVTNWSAFVGCFIGPVMGNFIIENRSYHDATLVVTLITAGSTLIYSVYLARRSCLRKPVQQMV